MQLISRGEILGLADYETIRARFRSRVILEKKTRRVPVGDRVTALFENRDTVLLQIQEMLRTERITKEAGVQHEIATYNQLVPGPRELSATLMIEIPDQAEREAFLDRARGFERHVALVVCGEKIAATWDESRVLPARPSSSRSTIRSTRRRPRSAPRRSPRCRATWKARSGPSPRAREAPRPSRSPASPGRACRRSGRRPARSARSSTTAPG